MSLRVLRPADYKRMPWKNGGGTTTELAVYPSNSAIAYDWRISIADIESNGPFSTFEGYDRYIALLEGVGMELRFDDGEPVRLEHRLQFVKFAGEQRIEGVLVSGQGARFQRDLQTRCGDASKCCIVRWSARWCSSAMRRGSSISPTAEPQAKAATSTCALEAGSSLLLPPPGGNAWCSTAAGKSCS